MPFVGLGATGADDADDSDQSLIHQDSDDDSDDDNANANANDNTIQDDDVDIGFRRHQYETVDNHNNGGRRPRKSRRRNQDEAIYGVFLEDDVDERRRKRTTATTTTRNDGPGGAPVFVAAQRVEGGEASTPVAAVTKDSTSFQSEKGTTSMFHKATLSEDGSQTPTPTPTPTAAEPPATMMFQKATMSDTGIAVTEAKTIEKHVAFATIATAETGTSKPTSKTTTITSSTTTTTGTALEQEKKKKDDADEKEEQVMLEKQTAADDYFQSLLQQAQDKKKRRRPPPPPPPVLLPPPPPPPPPLHSSMTGTGMPMAFGRASRFDMLDATATAATATATAATNPKKDPTIAKWEKHTKGFGSKLLSKMGWKGSGGLGSNRRKLTMAIDPAVAAAASSQAAHQAAMAVDAAAAVEEDESEKATQKTKGISRPVEVVVRPANLGLGYGNFKEMSQLKINRQIEAEVRGIELVDDKKKKKRRRGVLDTDDVDDMDGDDDDDDDDNDMGSSAMKRPSSASSAIPSTQELLNQKAWKRRKVKRPPPKVIPYEELVKQHEQFNQGQPVIIDMRGPSRSAAGTTAATDGKVPLGEELLHNVTFMLNTHENQLHSHTQMAKSTIRKQESLKSELQALQRQRQEANDRQQKLNKALEVVHEVETIATTEEYSRVAHEKAYQLIQDLGASLSPEDRVSLRFWQVLAPALLSPILQQQLDRWDPLGPTDRTKDVLDSLFKLRLGRSRDDKGSLVDRQGWQALRDSILRNQLIPRIQQVIESSRWDATRDTEVVLDLYEYIQHLASQSKLDNKNTTGGDSNPDNGQVLPGGFPEDGERKGRNLLDLFRKELVLDAIYPKLQTSLSHWKPSLRRGKPLGLERRIDLWILPWMPHLDHPAILPNLLADCKRKLKSSITYLQRKIGKEEALDFVRSSIDTLKPWSRVFDPKVVQRLVSEYVTPYLARSLATQRIRRDGSEQNWSSLHLTLECHARGLLSDVEFLSVIEGEFLTKWALEVNSFLLEGGMGLSEAALNYHHWKRQVLLTPTVQPELSISLNRSTQLLRDDARICGIFFTVLRMIEIAAKLPEEQDALDDLSPPRTNYHVVSGRRGKERQDSVQEDYVRMESKSATETEARLRLRRRNIHTPTFRDVVEEFANERGILFQPKLGANALKDGKQVFLFGDMLIYITGDVIYASEKSTVWRPMSLDQLEGTASTR